MKRFVFVVSNLPLLFTIGCSSAIPVLTTHIPPEPKTAQITYAFELGVADYNWFSEGAWGNSSEPYWSIPLGAGLQINYGLLKSLSISGLVYFSGYEIGTAAALRLHNHFSLYYFNLGLNCGMEYGEARDYAGHSSIFTPEIIVGFGQHVFAGYRYSPKRAKSVTTTVTEEPNKPKVTTKDITWYNIEHHNVIVGARILQKGVTIIPHVLYIIDPEQEFHQVMFGFSFSRNIKLRRHRRNRHETIGK